jgi:hypothetical protein
MAACLICHSDAHFRSAGSVKTYECPRCGQYELPGLGSWDTVEIPNQQVPISAWIRQQNAMVAVPFITLETLRRVRRIPIPTLRDRANLLLVALVKKYPRFNDGFVISTLCDDLALQAVTYSADQRDLNDLFAVLQNHDGFIELRATGSPPHAFEAGFALGLTVIPTCQADEIDQLHFDIRHLNTLAWTKPEDLAVKLSQRIRGVIGGGSNPV